LAWDSEHFGFPVAWISSPDLDDEALRDILHVAKWGDVRLVYWPTHPERRVHESILHEFSGILADRKATFTADLTSAPYPDRYAEAAEYRVSEHPKGEASERLIALAVTAGIFSRFHTDPQFPGKKWKSLYATWMRRSLSGELADSVLVASPCGDEAEVIGMVTVTIKGALGQIGLVAVLPGHAGRGIGRLMTGAAHRWMTARGAERSTVVTQLGNLPACRLYERSGYRLNDVRNYYHFWPQGGSGRVAYRTCEGALGTVPMARQGLAPPGDLHLSLARFSKTNHP
jgi:dTDP-4-amino-4,6-dideoxy-D-galactose acyltransferase